MDRVEPHFISTGSTGNTILKTKATFNLHNFSCCLVGAQETWGFVAFFHSTREGSLTLSRDRFTN